MTTTLARSDDARPPVASVAGETFSLQPRNFEEAWSFAETIARSDLAPSDYKGKPANVLVAIQMGGEVGLKPMQALQSIAIIKGRPTLWGDGLLGVVRAAPVCEWIKEYRVGKPGSDDFGWTCEAKRVGDPNVIANTFTVKDAKDAGLFGKEGPWKQYPGRMCKMRARSWTCRDGFADVLKGLKSAEEVLDIPDETREAIASAPTRTEAVKRALAARAPRQVGAANVTPANVTPASVTTTQEPAPQPSPEPAPPPEDPDFAHAPSQTLRDFVDELAITHGLSPGELAEIIRKAGGFKRSTLPTIVADIRAHGAPPPEPDEPEVPFAEDPANEEDAFA